MTAPAPQSQNDQIQAEAEINSDMLKEHPRCQPDNTAVPSEFVDWLADHIGTHKWVVARKSKKRIEDGYELFLTQKRFTALKQHFRKENGEMDTDGISQHLTEPDLDFAKKRKDTHLGMAFWAGTGPEGKTCRGCTRWQFDGYMASSGLLKDARCGKYKALTGGTEGAGIPHYAKACKYFEEAARLHPLEKPRTTPALPLEDRK